MERKVAPKSEVISSKSGKKAGNVTTALGSCGLGLGLGLGLLRLEEAFNGSGNLVMEDQEDVKVEPIWSEWWPKEWILEHESQQTSRQNPLLVILPSCYITRVLVLCMRLKPVTIFSNSKFSPFAHYFSILKNTDRLSVNDIYSTSKKIIFLVRKRSWIPYFNN